MHSLSVILNRVMLTYVFLHIDENKNYDDHDYDNEEECPDGATGNDGSIHPTSRWREIDKEIKSKASIDILLI